MKQRTRSQQQAVDVGFAIAANGDGIAYLASRAGRPSQGGDSKSGPVRIPFRCSPLAGLAGRDVAYAAVAAAAQFLFERGLRAVEIAVVDDSLVADLRERRGIPPALAMPYVGLRCKLNRFAHASLVVGNGTALADLTARARAEAALHVAA